MLGLMKKDWLYYIGFLMVIPIGLNELVIRGYLNDRSAIFRLAGAAGNGLLLVVGTAVFFSFYYFSVRALERERLS